MIIGVGIDVVQNDRIRDSLSRFGDRFLQRIYTETEIAYCTKCAEPAIHFAARFAAKEAAFKALGTGWAAGVKWKDVEVQRLPSGKPELHLYDEALTRATAMNATVFHVSLTHDKVVSCAVVIFESGSEISRHADISAAKDLPERVPAAPVTPAAQSVQPGNRRRFDVWFDGACGPVNPGGTAAYGYAIYEDGKKIADGSGVIGRGPLMSNNVAEYCGVIEAAKFINALAPGATVRFRGDSNMVVQQLSGNWKVKQGLYVPYHREAQQVLAGLKASFHWIPREENAEADALSKRPIETQS